MGDNLVEVKKRNIVVRIFRAIGGGIKEAVDYVVDVAKDVLEAFVPLLKTEAAKFVEKYRTEGIRIAIEAANTQGNAKTKIAYFAKEILKQIKNEDIPTHFINLLREVVVAELKEKGIIN